MMTITSQRGKIKLKRRLEGIQFLEGVDEYTRKSVGDFTHIEGVVPGRKGDHRGDL